MCSFRASSAPRCQVDGISVNDDKDPASAGAEAGDKSQLTPFGGLCCTFLREREKIPRLLLLQLRRENI